MISMGLDIGHSAVKLAFTDKKGNLHNMLIPTAVCQAFKISDDMEASRAAKDTVRVGSVDYFIGETAKVQGGSNITTGLSENWIETPEHSALMIGAFNRAIEKAGVDAKQVCLVMGLPTHLYSRQKTQLRQFAIQNLGVKELYITPQPMGPYLESKIKENGVTDTNIDNESWAVVEIGYFTTDFMLTMEGRWVEKASGTCSGAKVAAEHLQRILGEKNITLDLAECEQALRTKSIRNFTGNIDVSAEVNEAVSILVNEVVDTATRLFESYVRKLDGVIIAGGGAAFMFETIKKRWSHAISPANPRMSVAEGMRRMAATFVLADAQKNLKGE